jgi:hypothetical protein
LLSLMVYPQILDVVCVCKSLVWLDIRFVILLFCWPVSVSRLLVRLHLIKTYIRPMIFSSLILTSCGIKTLLSHRDSSLPKTSCQQIIAPILFVSVELNASPSWVRSHITNPIMMPSFPSQHLSDPRLPMRLTCEGTTRTLRHRIGQRHNIRLTSHMPSTI